MTERKFYACAYREGDTRTYTFHYDGEPLAEGDRVKIHTKNGGEQTVIVTMAMDEEPKFPTKAIIGKAPEKEEEAPA